MCLNLNGLYILYDITMYHTHIKSVILHDSSSTAIISDNCDMVSIIHFDNCTKRQLPSALYLMLNYQFTGATNGNIGESKFCIMFAQHSQKRSDAIQRELPSSARQQNSH